MIEIFQVICTNEGEKLTVAAVRVSVNIFSEICLYLGLQLEHVRMHRPLIKQQVYSNITFIYLFTFSVVAV